MSDLSVRQFFDFNPNNRGEDWADKIISHCRIHGRHIIDPKTAHENFDWLFGKWNPSMVKKMFTDDGKESNLDFTPTKVMEKYRNIILAELEDEGINIEVSAIDPSATNKRKKDRELLQNRKMIEGVMTQLGKSIGKPPYSLKDEPQRFNGNVNKFDEMGLAEGSDEDLDFFFTSFYRLSQEIALEAPILTAIERNELVYKLPFFVNDIMANNAIAVKTYVDDQSGLPTIKYLSPHLVKKMGGTSMDGKDAFAMFYEEQVSIMEFFRLVGDDFDFEQDYQTLLNAVNFCMGKNLTGISDGTRTWGTGEGSTMCDWKDFMVYTISIGYIEWKAINTNSYKETDKNFHGNPRVIKVAPDTEAAPNSNYKRTNKYNEITYKSYYIATATNIQKMFKYGKLCYQQIEGSEDEFSNFSICMVHNVGNSIVQIVIPHLIKLEKARQKHEWIFQAAKQPGYMIDIDSIMELANQLVKSGNTKNDVDTVLKMYATSPNLLYSKVNNDGANVGGNGVPIHELKNGLAVDALREFRMIMQECDDDIEKHIGFNGPRNAEQAGAREPVKLNMQAYESSTKATQYINRMLMNLFSNVGRKISSFSQDIIRYKDKNPMPYNAMLTALGDQTVEQIATLEGVPAHRYNLIIQPLSNKFDRQSLLRYAETAFANKEIKLEQLLLIKSERDPKRAAQLLAYMSKANERRQQDNQMQMMDKQDQLSQAEHQRKMELQTLMNKGGLDEAVERGKLYMLGYKMQGDASTLQTQMKIDAAGEQIDQRKVAKIEEQQAKENLAIQNGD